MKKFGFEPGPLVLAFVLGALLEESLRRSLLLFGGDATQFAGRPISAVLLFIFLVVLMLPFIQKARKKRTATTIDTKRKESV
jgi:putative tricarboxylic transport membrane protein